MPRPHLLPCIVLLTACAAAQSPTGVGTALAIGHGCALDVVDGTLTAIGDDYKATFVGGQLVFTPLLGRTAPHNLPLALRVTHTGRGAMQPVGSGTTQHEALVATCTRPEFVERLEVRPEGIKQSYVFTQLPPGDGDLVVRSQLRSDLRPEANASTGALRFLRDGLGGVAIGQVLGIDADGRTAPGSLHVDGDHLDVVLPAAFVRGAKLPLVVDPLLSAVVVTASTLPDSAPDVAPLPAPTDAYLVVWLRAVSATDNDVRAQRVSAAGALLGGLVMLETSTFSAGGATVAASPTTASWLVAFELQGDIKGRFMTGAGVLQNPIDIANGANTQRTPCLGGGLLGGNDATVCVWHDQTTNQILHRRIDHVTQNAFGPPRVVASGTQVFPVSTPTISRDNRAETSLVAWQTSSLLGQRAVRGLVVDLDGNALTAAFPVAGSTSTDAFAPTCAGEENGSFVVAWRTNSTLLGDGAACAPVTYTFAPPPALGSASVGAARTITGPNGPARSTAVAMFQGSAVVAFASTATTGHDVRALSIDPLTCSDCEGSLAVDTGGNDTGVAICSRAFGPAQTSPNAGAVVYIPIVGGQGDVTLRLVRADDGLRDRIDIACTSGSLFAPCARAGNANYGIVLRGAAPNELALVVHSLGLMNFPCSGCLIGPDTTIGVVDFLGATSATGGIRAPLPLPGGPTAIGATVHSQFVLFGGPCLGNFRGTGGISATLQ